MSSKTNISVFGIYPDLATVNEGMKALQAAGFRHADISVLHSDNRGTKDFSHERHSKAPEGAVAGGGSGAVVGAAIGWLAGSGALLVPGLEPMAAAGPMLGMFGGLGAGVSVGGIAGAIVGSGIPEYEAKRYEGRVRKGGVLVSVHCDNEEWTKTAQTVLRKTGALDISKANEAKADFASADKPLPRPRHSPLR